MLKQSQVTVMSMSKWADFIAIDFTPSPFHFFPKTRCLCSCMSSCKQQQSMSRDWHLNAPSTNGLTNLPWLCLLRLLSAIGCGPSKQFWAQFFAQYLLGQSYFKLCVCNSAAVRLRSNFVISQLSSYGLYPVFIPFMLHLTFGI